MGGRRPLRTLFPALKSGERARSGEQPAEHQARESGCPLLACPTGLEWGERGASYFGKHFGALLDSEQEGLEIWGKLELAWLLWPDFCWQRERRRSQVRKKWARQPGAGQPSRGPGGGGAGGRRGHFGGSGGLVWFLFSSVYFFFFSPSFIFPSPSP